MVPGVLKTLMHVADMHGLALDACYVVTASKIVVMLQVNLEYIGERPRRRH